MGGVINRTLETHRERRIANYGTFRLLLFGLDEAGKTSILNYIKTNDCGHTEPTALFNVESLSLSGSLNVSVRDFGGRAEYRGQWVRSITGGDAVLYVVDSSDTQRIEESKLELEKLLDSIISVKIPLLILANKQDLPTALSEDEMKKLFVTQLLKQKDRLSGVYPISAVSGNGINELIVDMKRYFKSI
ncbi:ADP-ribosylation factor 6-like [Oopsacas minuta]|uniref:ADP-ribosylation factor 6-like n=1 Tax=Oopsacas minuta TaxID=111878 RepID=A0AAV7JB93_9METZ|nr:ADP-ribosylation factor 6-like [Oopsacas minuta]